MSLAVTACPQFSWNFVSVRISAALTAVFEIFAVSDSGSNKQSNNNSGRQWPF